MKIKEILVYFTDTIFRRDASEWHTPLARWFVQQYKLLFYTARGLYEHGTLIRSAALTFYTLMSLVPILAVAFAVVKGFGLADGLVRNLYGIFPQSPEMIDYIVSFVENALARTQGGLVAVVALVMLFWAVIRVFGSIESAFNNIWEVKISRSIARQWSNYIAIMMIVPVLWVIVGAVGGYARELVGFDGGRFFGLLSRLVSVATICLLFTIFYFVIPNARVRFSSALTAGIIAGTAFVLFQWGYLYVQRWMTSYNAIYGSFAALPLFLVWLQTSWQILLFGGELSFAYQNVARFCEERESLRISYEQRRKIWLAMMLAVVGRFREKGGPTSTETIRRRLELPTRIVNEVLYQLVQAGQLVAVPMNDDDRDMGFMPAHDIATITLGGLLDALEQSGQGNFDPVQTPEFLRAEGELERLERRARNLQEGVRLIDLLDNPIRNS